MPHYDVIVLGTGGVGSAVLLQLARRGARVLGIDRFAVAHDRGSSHGHTRIIRRAYFEHPDYVPLLREAYRQWHELQDRAGRQLYFPVGLLEIGPPDGVVVAGVLRSAAEHGLDVERISAEQLARRFPGFQAPQGAVAVFERDAGYLLVEDCVRAQIELARQAGAGLRTGQQVEGWRADDRGVTVTCRHESFAADKLVIAAGPWAGPLLGIGDLDFTVLAKHLHWYANGDPRYTAAGGCPAFLFELPDGYFYGFPQSDARGVKVAEHSGGDAVASPSAVDRSVDPADRARVEQFLAGHLPGVTREATDHTVCLYTMTRDEHFVVDRHPQYPHVCFAAGLSGHGFKFAPALGRVLAELALDDGTELPVGFLKLSCGP